MTNNVLPKRSIDEIARIVVTETENREKFSESVKTFFEHGVDLRLRTVYVGSVTFDAAGSARGLDARMAEYVIKDIILLNCFNSDPIRMIMNNSGGSVCDGYAIYDAIASSQSPVDIEVLGQAMSMGAVIMQAGRNRAVYPNTQIMIHDGYLSFEGMPTRSAEAWAKFGKRERNRMYKIFSERTGHPISFWREKFSHDYLIDPKEALDLGLVDEIKPHSSWRTQLKKKIQRER